MSSVRHAPRRSSLEPQTAVTALVLAVVAYLAVLTRDVQLGPVPLKVVLVAAALGAWFATRGRHLRRADVPFAIPVLAVALGVPIVWSVVGLLTGPSRCEVAYVTTGNLVAEASRFGYLLLYFPLVDLLPRRLSRGHLGWMACAGLLVVITWALGLALTFGDPPWRNTTTAYAFGGAFGKQGPFERVFIGNQVFLLPAIAVLVVRNLDRRRPLELLALAALFSAIFVAHTRGLVLATAAVVGVSVVLRSGLRPVAAIARRPTLWLALGAVVVVVVSVLLLGSVVPLPGFLGDQSARFRVGQAGFLTDAWKSMPVLGSGMGASLSSGFARAADAPWSFELTYLQLLFQFGVIGLIAVLWPAAAALVAGVRAAVSNPLGGSAAAGVATLVGLFAASASNPYLLSAYGMLTFALALALVAHAVPERAPAEQPATAPTAQRLSRVRLGWAGAFVAIAFALVVVELAAPRTVAGGVAPLSVGDPNLTSPSQVTDGGLAARPGCA